VGVDRAVGRAATVLALCDDGPAVRDGLSDAISVLEGAGAPVELARAELELGAAVRRAGRGSRRARRCAGRWTEPAPPGAEVVAVRARAELVAAGARPQRERSSGPDALTASERRVVDLAVAGSSNREIAQTLFLTQKTVETHLSSAYRKLDISSRRELGPALAA
jgi:DNA-binding NarL/FixJ family response regulator